MPHLTPPETVLVALLKNRTDHALLHDQLWYRIPVDKAPGIVRSKQLKYMGFYLPSVFGARKWKVYHYGRVKGVSEVIRNDLFPNEPALNIKAKKRYYKIEFESLQTLDNPIVSPRGHRLLFVPTTEQKFFNARNLNTIFNASPLEDLLYDQLEQNKIESERQWLEYTKESGIFWLDFAVFCKKGKINIECDGDKFHMAPDQVKYDKSRNNELTGMGWKVLRYTTDELTNKMNKVMENIWDTIVTCGGNNSFVPPRVSKNGQLNLF